LGGKTTGAANCPKDFLRENNNNNNNKNPQSPYFKGEKQS